MQNVFWELSRKNSHKNKHKLHELTLISCFVQFLNQLEFVPIRAIRVNSTYKLCPNYI